MDNKLLSLLLECNDEDYTGKTLFQLESSFGLSIDISIEELKFRDLYPKELKGILSLYYTYYKYKMNHLINSGVEIGSKSWDRTVTQNRRHLQKIVDNYVA